jgi:cell division protein FtsW
MKIFISIWKMISGSSTHLKWLKEKENSQITVQYSRYSDRWLIFTILALMSIGLMMVYSASVVKSGVLFKNPEHFFHQQFRFMVGGLLLIGIVSRIPYQVWGNSSYLFFGISVIFLLLVFSPYGKVVNGARRWIYLGFNFQPVELVKITWILLLCHYHSDPKLNMAKISSTLLLLGYAVLFAIPLILQPDFGSILFLLLLFGISFFIAGGFILRLIVGLGTPVFIIGLIMSNRFAHILNRINSFIAQFTGHQDVDYNVQQALISFGSGRWFGVGVGQSSQKGFFLPEAHTDFIFDIYGEEFGLLGVLVLVGLYLFLFLRGLYIARNASTVFGNHLASLISIMILTQALINMSMAIGLLPTKGITLPLISYGGSSLLIMCLTLGILLNISRQTPTSHIGLALINLSRKCYKAREE